MAEAKAPQPAPVRKLDLRLTAKEAADFRVDTIAKTGAPENVATRWVAGSPEAFAAAEATKVLLTYVRRDTQQQQCTFENCARCAADKAQVLNGEQVLQSFVDQMALSGFPLPAVSWAYRMQGRTA